MSKISKSEIVQIVSDHTGLSKQDVIEAMNAPTHPAGLRDEFAGQALNGLIWHSWQDDRGRAPMNPFERWAKQAYAAADAMLKERAK